MDLIDLPARVGRRARRCGAEQERLSVRCETWNGRVGETVGQIHDRALDLGAEHREVDARLSAMRLPEETQQVGLTVGDGHLERIGLRRRVIDVIGAVDEISFEDDVAVATSFVTSSFVTSSFVTSSDVAGFDFAVVAMSTETECVEFDPSLATSDSVVGVSGGREGSTPDALGSLGFG